MDYEDIIVIMNSIEAMDSSSSSSSSDDDEEDLLFIASLVEEVCDTESHAKIRNYVDNVVSEYSDGDVSVLILHL